MDYDQDDNEIDFETEAELYSLVYFAPLDNTVDEALSLKSPKVSSNESDSRDVELLTTVQKSDRSSECCLSNGISESGVLLDTASVYSTSESSVLSSNFDPDEYLKYLPAETNITSNFENYDDDEVQCCSSFCPSLPENAMEVLTTTEILARLPDDPDLWKICDDDVLASEMSCLSSKGRYYTKRMRCRRCNEEGHRIKDCPNKSKKICNLCGDTMHWMFKCKFKACMMCLKFGHFSLDCRLAKYHLTKMFCVRCKRKGHSFVDCPELWRQFKLTTDNDLLFEELKRSNTKKSKNKYCYNCGCKGHFGHECRKHTNYDDRIIAFDPTVTLYDSGPVIKMIEEKTFDPAKIEKQDATSVPEGRAFGEKCKKRKEMPWKTLLKKSQINFRRLLKKERKPVKTKESCAVSKTEKTHSSPRKYVKTLNGNTMKKNDKKQKNVSRCDSMKRKKAQKCANPPATKKPKLKQQGKDLLLNNSESKRAKLKKEFAKQKQSKHLSQPDAAQVFEVKKSRSRNFDCTFFKGKANHLRFSWDNGDVPSTKSWL